MKNSIIQRIEQLLGVKIVETQLIQSLWSGYGGLYRLKLSDTQLQSIIVKHISYSNVQKHPRGWTTNVGHQRKVQSYQVETAFYEKYLDAKSDVLMLPRLLKRFEMDGDTFLILSDLEQQQLYPQNKITMNGIQITLNWLASFHVQFLSQKPEGLWPVGSYWHLATRQEEFNQMPSGNLKDKAGLINERLNNARFKTIIHGDAKWANFCFSENQQQVAGVDFQYAGAGCGMKDIMYFLSSVFNDEQLTLHADKMVDHYFRCFHSASQEIMGKNLSLEIENEWRELYPFAWADFTRFLQGWMPTHQKLTGYALKQTELALRLL